MQTDVQWVVDNPKKELWTKGAHGIDIIRIPIDSGIVGSAVVVKSR